MAVMTERDRLLDLLRRLHSGSAWHGPSVMEAVSGIDHQRAASRPFAGAHSIWEIALHIAAWRGEVTARLGGKRPGAPAQGDWPAVTDAGPEAWHRTHDALQESHSALVAKVRTLSDADLERRVGSDDDPSGDVTVALTLHGIVQHDAYHAGQISLLKKSFP
jgi:uncharacterized damage-inducible protein DinB